MSLIMATAISLLGVDRYAMPLSMWSCEDHRLYQNESLRGGPLGKRARFLPMLDMNSPKKEPPLKMGTPRLVGRVHLDTKGEKLAWCELSVSSCL